MENKYRTHLIFDYVDEDYQLPPRILLTPDDIILQTRRSIDLKREVMQYRVEESQPRFLIIGAQVISFHFFDFSSWLSCSFPRKQAQLLCMSISVSTRWL